MQLDELAAVAGLTPPEGAGSLASSGPSINGRSINGTSTDGMSVGGTSITGLALDSRAVRPGFLFAALPGAKADGRGFIADAVAAGAAAILAPPGTVWPPGVAPRPLLLHPEPARALALIAAHWAGRQPDRLVAVTGTNGKTSTVEFLRQLWALRGARAASLGTLGITGPDGIASGASLTTPDSISLAASLARLAAGGITHAALEASSHGLSQQRLDGLRLSAAGFSNLTRDHLDYHGSLGAYREAKLRLFATLLPEGSVAAANGDMEPETLAALRAVARQRRLQLRLVGSQGDAIRLRGVRPLPSGQVMTVQALGRSWEIELNLPGRYQVENILLAAVLAETDLDALGQVLPLAARLQGVRGRLEQAVRLANGAAAYVDYAHTPDALARLLSSLRPHAGPGRLVVVFGAGGDRDRGKRPLMGAEAARLADIAIVTDDNPRSEQPAAIRAAILAGCPGGIEIGDRAAAIAAGLDMLRPGDVLVVAGKGHEQGQVVAGEVLPFDDRDVLRRLAGERQAA